MSALRARCPDCHTLTAVAVDSGYQCHRCGREFAAGLVRVPRAWGKGGEAMAEAAKLHLPYPETAVVECATLTEQTTVLAERLPARPVLAGGCCCAHVGVVRGLANRGGRLAVVWLDAHGDLNTPESSPSGNEWGMPLRMLLDDGVVSPQDVALVGARNLDPPELEYLESTGIGDSIERALAGVDRAYIALDLDVLAPGEAEMFMPEPAGPTIADVQAIVRGVATTVTVAGMGLTGMLPVEENVPVVSSLLAAAGL
jgi:arginase